MHWPSPAQRPRIAEIRDNLIARIAEAEREGWHGEAEGLRISLASAEDKLAQVDRRSATAGRVTIGMPPSPASPMAHPQRHAQGTPMTPTTAWLNAALRAQAEGLQVPSPRRSRS